MKSLIIIMLTIIPFWANSQNLRDSLIAYYPFTGNAIDSSGKGNNGTLNGATLVSDRFGKSNSAYSFDGVNDDIRVKNLFNGKQPFSNNVTVCYWLKTTTTKNAAAILTLHSACSNNNNDLMTFYINNAAGSHFLNNAVYWHSPLISIDESSVTDNSWHFVGYTYNNDTACLYLDGIRVAKLAVSPEPNFYFDKSVDLTIGNISTNACGYDFFFEGLLDEIAIFNRTLTQKEIIDVKNDKLKKINNSDVKINKIASLNPPNIFPNPSQNLIQISNLSATNLLIKIIDYTGRIVLTDNTDGQNQKAINTTDLPNGIYTIAILDQTNRLVSNQKLVIIK